MAKRGRKSRPILDRIKDRVLFDGEHWKWLGSTSGWTGEAVINGGVDLGQHRTVQVRKVLYERIVGPVADGDVCRPACELGSKCVAPAHTEVTEARHSGCRLTEKEVAAIRYAATLGERQTALAVAYGVHKATVNAIVHGRSWKGVGDGEDQAAA